MDDDAGPVNDRPQTGGCQAGKVAADDFSHCRWVNGRTCFAADGITPNLIQGAPYGCQYFYPGVGQQKLLDFLPFQDSIHLGYRSQYVMQRLAHRASIGHGWAVSGLFLRNYRHYCKPNCKIWESESDVDRQGCSGAGRFDATVHQHLATVFGILADQRFRQIGILVAESLDNFLMLAHGGHHTPRKAQ